jgi:hypothetical protein
LGLNLLPQKTYQPVAALYSGADCCIAKTRLHTNDQDGISFAAAVRPPAALSAFLDVSSLNLAVLCDRHFFWPWEQGVRQQRNQKFDSDPHKALQMDIFRTGSGALDGGSGARSSALPIQEGAHSFDRGHRLLLHQPMA